MISSGLECGNEMPGKHVQMDKDWPMTKNPKNYCPK
jgi:hypothetical protein